MERSCFFSVRKTKKCFNVQRTFKNSIHDLFGTLAKRSKNLFLLVGCDGAELHTLAPCGGKWSSKPTLEWELPSINHL